MGRPRCRPFVHRGGDAGLADGQRCPTRIWPGGLTILTVSTVESGYGLTVMTSAPRIDAVLSTLSPEEIRLFETEL
jgi:hypothetical protein